jgi:tRNA (mo5U34)-methyltransferase
MFFIEHEYAHDPTNWWTPNRAGSMAMLRSSGFEVLSNPEPEVFLCRRVERPADWYGPVYPAKGAAR